MPTDVRRIEMTIKRKRAWWLFARNEMNDPRGFGVRSNGFFSMVIRPGRIGHISRDGSETYPDLAFPPGRATPEDAIELRRLFAERQTRDVFCGVPPLNSHGEINEEFDTEDFRAVWAEVFVDEGKRFICFAS